MEYLYVCHFSNGHIKVGRSVAPKSRIATHADRVSCVGVELVEHHIVECLGKSAQAEAVLIRKCADVATKRNKGEWFEGLDYLDVCDLANACAANTSQPKAVKSDVGINVKGLLKAIGGQCFIAKTCNVTEAAVSQWGNSGSLPAAREQYLRLAYQGPHWDLYDKHLQSVKAI